jgi:hypothetical protein
MFEDLRKAWRQAVDNFRAEVAGLEPGAIAAHVHAMRRDIDAARALLLRLESDLAVCVRDAASERGALADARRREALARQAGDGETAGVAAHYVARHARRLDVLERKAEVLSAERDLRREELAAMETTFGEALRLAAEAPPPDEIDAGREAQFRDLEREARAREAERRLEELKKRMR